MKNCDSNHPIRHHIIFRSALDKLVYVEPYRNALWPKTQSWNGRQYLDTNLGLHIDCILFK